MVFEPNECQYLHKSLKHCYAMIKNSIFANNRWRHGKRISHFFEVIVFATAMEKEELTQPMAMSWITSKVPFALAKSKLLRLWRWKTVREKLSILECNYDISHKIAKFWKFHQDSMIYKHKNLVKQWYCKLITMTVKINCST